MTSLLVLHAASTLAMTGLIWFVQVVHYPLFRFAAPRDLPEVAAFHQRRTTLVVLPLMSVELVTALLLAVGGGPETKILTIPGLLLLLVIWLSTALVQVPLHRTLAKGLDGNAVSLLVHSNWLRTVAWSARAAIALALIAP